MRNSVEEIFGFTTALNNLNRECGLNLCHWFVR
jgi:hypothetical protein